MASGDFPVNRGEECDCGRPSLFVRDQFADLTRGFLIRSAAPLNLLSLAGFLFLRRAALAQCTPDRFVHHAACRREPQSRNAVATGNNPDENARFECLFCVGIR